MRGPQGPVRGGVTRCGRPPPLCRGRGRGKTSRLPTSSCSPTAGDRQLDMSINSIVLRGAMLSRRIERGATLFTEDEMVQCTVKFLRSWRIARQVGFPAKSRKRGRGANAIWTTTKEEDERSDDKMRRVKGFSKRFRAMTASLSTSSCWRFSALNVAWRVPRLWRALRSIAPERSRRDMVFYAVSRPDHRRPSRLITACRTRLRRSAPCATCHRSPRRHGAAPDSPTQCRRSVRNSLQYQTRACHGRNAPTSRG